MRLLRAFTSQTDFDTWHDQVKTATGMPIIGRNAKTGELQPDKQQTTDYTSVGPAEVDEDGNVIDPTLVATVGDDRLVRRGLTDGLVRAGLFTTTELDELAALYPDWVEGTRVEAGDIRAYDGKLWEAKQEHETAPGKEPPNAPGDWKAPA